MARHNLLTTEQEIELSERIRQNDDQEAFETMVRANLGLAVYVAQKMPAWHIDGCLDHDDLVQEANIALMQAVRTWKPQGHRFATYARKLIHSRVMRAIENTGHMIRIPVPVQEDIRKIKKAEKDLTQQLGREPTIDELSERTKLSKDTVRDRLIVNQRQPVSLDAFNHREQQREDTDYD